MLVEHRKGLEDILKHEEDIDRPVLDNQQLERLDSFSGSHQRPVEWFR